MLILHLSPERPKKAPAAGIAIRVKKVNDRWTFVSAPVREGDEIHASAVIMESTYKLYPDLKEFREKQEMMLRLPDPREWWRYLDDVSIVRH